jgi:hypothetical protein
MRQRARNITITYQNFYGEATYVVFNTIFYVYKTHLCFANPSLSLFSFHHKSTPSAPPTAPQLSLPLSYLPYTNKMAVVAEKNVQEEQAKKTFMSRLRRHKQQSTGVYTMKDREQHQETRTPSPATKKPMSKSVTRDGVPVISSTAGEDQKFKPSQVRPNKSVVKNGKNYARKSVILESAPAARDSAFSGPPRYDWIDIVSPNPCLSLF